MQPQPSPMQKTWSNDSLTQLVPSTSARRLSVDVDRPRKHARRTSLPVRNDRAAAHGGGTEASTSRYTNERRRFRDSLAASAPTTRNHSSRRESAPALARPVGQYGKMANGQQQQRRKIFGVGEEGDDEDDEDGGDEALDSEDEAGDAEGADTSASTAASYADGIESSTTYAAGPSSSGGGGRRRPTMQEASSSDASSSERHPFDWDVPNRRMTPLNGVHAAIGGGGAGANGGAAVGARSNSPAGLQQRRGRTQDVDGLERKGVQRRGTASTPANGTPGDSASCSTPTVRNINLDGDGIGHAPTATGRMAQSFAKATGFAAGGGASERAYASSQQQQQQQRQRVSSAKTFKRLVPCNTTTEAGLLVLASVIVSIRLGRYPDEATRTHAWELMSLVIASSTYYIFCRRQASEENASIWATSLRQYRACGDDGAMCGLLLGPLLGVTCLFASLDDKSTFRSASGDGLPFPVWRVETPPLLLGSSRIVPHPTMTALALSRCTLLSLQTAMSTTLLVHLLSTKYMRTPDRISNSSWHRLWSYIKFASTVAGMLTLMREIFARLGVPLWTGLSRGELVTCTLLFQVNLYTISQLARKSFTLGELSVVACVGVTLTMEAINLSMARLFPNTTPFVKTFRRPTPLLIFQLALVVGTFMIGFLLSPLLYLSRHLAQKPVHRLRWPHKRDLHRRLLAFFFYFFAALYVIGVLGFWVYWLLEWQNPWMWTLRFVVSGYRWWSRPVLITFWIALIGTSIAGWQATVLSGKRFRVRPAASHVVAASPPVSASTNSSTMLPASRLGLTAAVVPSTSANEGLDGAVSVKTAAATTTTPTIGKSMSNGGDLAHQIFPKRAAYLSLNARRKFFHALAVLLFAPGIAFDPAFTHLAFSLAFSVFIFAEYVRYYALYPFGAALHVFLSEFTDHKDSGPVILSHFYLLTGCAGVLWIEGMHGTSTRAGLRLAEHVIATERHSSDVTLWNALLGTLRWVQDGGGDGSGGFVEKATAAAATAAAGQNKVDISMFIGVLTLGVGDALASIIGRRYGRVRWPDSGKTVEGTLAFVTSIFVSAVLLRAVGWCAAFSLWRFGVVSVVLGFVEGISNQNDNLVLPIYGFIALSVLRV